MLSQFVLDFGLERPYLSSDPATMPRLNVGSTYLHTEVQASVVGGRTVGQTCSWTPRSRHPSLLYNNEDGDVKKCVVCRLFVQSVEVRGMADFSEWCLNSVVWITNACILDGLPAFSGHRQNNYLLLDRNICSRTLCRVPCAYLQRQLWASFVSNFRFCKKSGERRRLSAK